MCADAVGFFAAPNVIAVPWAFFGGTDAFAPFVVAAEEAAPANDAGGEGFGDIDEVRAPIVGVIGPCGFDGGIGDAEWLHELHEEARRDFEEWRGINDDVRGLGLGAGYLGIGGGEGGSGGSGAEESSAFHGGIGFVGTFMGRLRNRRNGSLIGSVGEISRKRRRRNFGTRWS